MVMLEYLEFPTWHCLLLPRIMTSRDNDRTQNFVKISKQLAVSICIQVSRLVIIVIYVAQLHLSA